MIPPIDSSILTANPQFAALHKTLTTKLLNPDGSTKNHRTQHERDARAPELYRRQVEAAKAQILKSALAHLPLTQEKRSSRASRTSKTSTRETPLPADVTELMILLTLQLTTALSPRDTLLLQNSSAYQSLPQHISSISTHISTHVTAIALPLTRLLNPYTNSSFLHRSIPSLATSLTTLLSQISHSRQALTTTRLLLTPLSLTLLHQYTLITQCLIQHLSTTKHGLLSRHVLASSHLLSLQSRVSLLDVRKTSLIARGVVYTPEIRRALVLYGENLRDGRARLGMRERDARRVLRGYGVGWEEDGEDNGEGRVQERTMREIARVWGEMEGQVEMVRRDIERLGGR